jgi:lipid II:glycine glycyltransferase (peptidoglycan interpeptide bridge formation enzyme)
VTIVLSISRNRWGIHITQIYFPEENNSTFHPSTDLVGIIHSSTPIKGLAPIETLQKDLTKDADALFMDISKSTRKQIKQAQKDSNLITQVLTEPSDEDILIFQKFYNQFAAIKNTYRCKPYHVETLKLLRDQKALIITKIEGADQQPLCYRVYAADRIRAMPYYSASRYILTDDSHLKRQLGKANRLLQWEDMLWFKSRGYQIYDSGGLTNNPNIRNYKLEFGGRIITEYSGYLPKSLKGSIALSVRNWRFSKKIQG